ncbi:MAG: transcriptional repressor LexA [Eubacterium sp.]
MYDDLTQKQKEILEFIKTETRKCGFPPSVREICKAVGFRSTSSVHGHLKVLEELSYIRRTSSKTRSIDVVDKSNDEFCSNKEMILLPRLGKITAGEPIFATEDFDDVFPLPLDFVGTGEHFLLQVRGTSMIDAGILDGDDIIVKKQETAKDGDIVVAFLLENEEATVKTFYRDQDIIILKPQNPAFSPRELKDTEVSILGKVTGLLRKF